MVERQLASKEAYLAASVEMKSTDRQSLLAETKSLLQEILQNSGVDAKTLAEQKDAKVSATETMEAKVANATKDEVKTEIAVAPKLQDASPEKAARKVPVAFTPGSVPIVESMTPTTPLQGKQ